LNRTVKMSVQVESIDNQANTVLVESLEVESENPAKKVGVEEVRVNRQTVTNFCKSLLQKGEVRRILVQNKQGKTLVEIPLLVAAPSLVLGTVLFPLAVAVLATAGAVANLNVVVERKEESKQ